MGGDIESEEKGGEYFVPNRAGRRAIVAYNRKAKNKRGPNFTKPKKRKKRTRN